MRYYRFSSFRVSRLWYWIKNVWKVGMVKCNSYWIIQKVCRGKKRRFFKRPVAWKIGNRLSYFKSENGTSIGGIYIAYKRCFYFHCWTFLYILSKLQLQDNEYIATTLRMNYQFAGICSSFVRLISKWCTINVFVLY